MEFNKRKDVLRKIAFVIKRTCELKEINRFIYLSCIVEFDFFKNHAVSRIYQDRLREPNVMAPHFPRTA